RREEHRLLPRGPQREHEHERQHRPERERERAEREWAAPAHEHLRVGRHRELAREHRLRIRGKLGPERQLAVGTELPADAEPVLAGQLAMPPDAKVLVRWSGPFAFGALALALGAVLALVLVLALRAAREQAVFLAS